MSDDLPNQNSSNPWEPTPPQPTPSSEVPNPPDHVVDPVQSWVAQHQQRDENGRFVPSEHIKSNPQTLPTSPNIQNTPNSSSLPSPVSFTQNNKYSEKNDPPLVALSVTNPVTYLKKWLARLLKNEGIDIHIKIKPLTVIGFAIAFATISGVSFNIGSMFFPNSSPILHRAITLQGTVQVSNSGQYYLSLPDNTLWTLKPINSNTNFTNLINKQVLVKGNMTKENNVVEVKEIVTFKNSSNEFNSFDTNPTIAQ